MKAVHGATLAALRQPRAGLRAERAARRLWPLKTMIDRWRDVFDDAFGRNDKHKARNFVSMALEARNATSHLAIPLQDDEALRYLDAMHQLLQRGEGAGERSRGVEEALRCATRNPGFAHRSPQRRDRRRRAEARPRRPGRRAAHRPRR